MPLTAGKIQHSVSIVVTAYNEDVVVEQVIRETWAVAEQMLETYELILVDDGSIDQTGPIMDRLARELTQTRVFHNRPNLGFGTSYLRGVAEARHDYVMLVCGDNGVPAVNQPAIINKIGTADIVIPYMRNLHLIKTPFRYFISRTYTNFLNFVFGLRLKYYNGLSVHRRDLVSLIHVKSSGFGFQGELLIKLIKSGCSYVEIGVDGATKEQQRSVLLRPKNVLNIMGTCVRLLRELRAFKAIKHGQPERQANNGKRPS